MSNFLSTKYFSLLFVATLFFISCEDERVKVTHTEEDLSYIISLEEKYGTDDFMLPAEILFPMEATPQVKSVPDSFENFVIRSYIFAKDQHLYLQYKNAEVSAEEYEILKSVYQVEEAKLTEQAMPTEILVVIGDLKNGKRGIAFDTNFDNDFSNEAIVEFDYPMEFIDEDDEAFFQENKLDFLPQIDLRLPFVKNNEVVEDEISVALNPYKPFDRFYVSNDSKENDFYLELIFPTYYESIQEIGGKKYRFQVGPSTNLARLSAKNASVLINEIAENSEEEASNKESYLRIQPQDTFNLDWKDYVLDVSNFEAEKQVTLVSLGENTRPKGGFVGYFAELPSGVSFLTNPTENEETPSEETQYTLYFAWTTWSLSSLQEVPSLVDFQANFPQVEVLGVCFDENRGAAERMQFRRAMQWKSAFIESGKHQHWTNKMRIDSYPTYILVDKNLQVQTRSHHLKEIEKWLYATSEE